MRLPSFDAFGHCPKCRPANPDSFSYVTTEYHPEVQEADQKAPCAVLKLMTLPEEFEDLELGEHLCRLCTNCHFGWVCEVARPGSVYALPEPEDGG